MYKHIYVSVHEEVMNMPVKFFYLWARYNVRKYIQEEDEMSDDAINLVDSDNMLVCARCEKDYAQLDIYGEIHVFII